MREIIPRDNAKACCRCGEIKSLTEFHRDPHIKSGRKGACKACRLPENRVYRATHLEEARLSTRKSRQKNPAYYRQKNFDWKKRNPDKVAAQGRRFRQSEHGKIIWRLAASRRRARVRGVSGTFSVLEWLALLELQRHRCFYCKRKFTAKRPATQDHLVPISLGGPNSATNIVAACKSCNCSKKAKRTVLL